MRTYKKSIGKWRSLFQAKTSLKSLLEKLSGIKKKYQWKICIHLLRLFLWRTQKSKNVGCIKIIVENGPENQGSRKPGATSRLTFLESSMKPEDRLGTQRPRGMQQMCKQHKPIRRFSPICIRTTPWRCQILQRRHKPTEPRSFCWQRQSWRYQAKLLP